MGETTVSLEYEVNNSAVSLQDVVISIPIPDGVTPEIGDCPCGTFKVDARQHVVQWHLGSVNQENSSGNFEFVVAPEADPSAFFPVEVSFNSADTFAQLAVQQVRLLSQENQPPAPFHFSASLTAEAYSVS